MDQLQKLEVILDGVFRKNAPYQLPDSVRKSIAGVMAWLALVFGAAQIGVAATLWNGARRVEHLVDNANSFTTMYANPAIHTVDHLGIFLYLSLAVMVITGVLLFAAFPKLKDYQKQGWNLVFYAALLNVLIGVAMIFSEYNGGFGQFVFSLFESAVGLYFLFQVREYFTGIRPALQKIGVEKNHR